MRTARLMFKSTLDECRFILVRRNVYIHTSPTAQHGILLKMLVYLKIKFTSRWSFKNVLFIAGVVHEHPRIGSDGESEEGSGTSEPNVSPGSEDLSSPSGTNHTSMVKLRQKPNQRKLSNQEEINKRLSLPADLKIPENFISRQTVSPTLEGPLSRWLFFLVVRDVKIWFIGEIYISLIKMERKSLNVLVTYILIVFCPGCQITLSRDQIDISYPHSQ